MTIFFSKFKKTLVLVHFGHIFPIFEAKVFPKNSHATSYGYLAPCQNLEKTNDPVPRKCWNRRKDGGMDRWMDRPYFIGPFWLLPGVQKFRPLLGSSPKFSIVLNIKKLAKNKISTYKCLHYFFPN